MPSEWKDALLIPLPKQGHLCCVDWRGISLLVVIVSWLPECLMTDCKWWWGEQSRILNVGLGLVEALSV